MNDRKHMENYYDQRQKQKTFHETNSLKITTRKHKKENYLNDEEIQAYRWMVDSGFLRFIDYPTQDRIIETIAENKFRSLFLMGRFFKIFASSPKSQNFYDILESLQNLIICFKEKEIIHCFLNPELIIRHDKSEIFKLIISCYNFTRQRTHISVISKDLVSLSNWLKSLGIFPPFSDWFVDTRPLYLIEDPLRNGEVLCKICVVFRPERFHEVIPPARTPKEMIKRNEKALKVLLEESIIDQRDANLAEEIVRGTTDAIVQILLKAQKEHRKREEAIISYLSFLHNQ